MSRWRQRRRARKVFARYEALAPEPSNYANEIDDLSRDLLAVGQRTRGSAEDFRSDLSGLTDPPSKPGLDGFGLSIVGAVEGRRLEPPKAKRLAELLYSSMDVVDLTEQDRGGVQSELSGLLKEIGAPPARVTAVEGALRKMVPGAAK